MQVNVYSSTTAPAYRLLLPVSASVDELADNLVSGVQLMQPLVLHAENVALSTIAAGRLHAVLREALWLHGRAFLAIEQYGLQHRMRIDIYLRGDVSDSYLAVPAGRTLASLENSFVTGIASMLPLTPVAQGVLLASVCQARSLNWLFTQIEMIDGALVDPALMQTNHAA